jgi:prepilin signal peptidase PulO-like enzyme (type II secretory pathway)
VYTVSQDTRLLDEFEYSIKNLYDDGFIVFTTFFLVSIWILTALQAWGMGTGIAFGLATYIVAALFDLHGYLNPGCATTLTAFAGGLFGYFTQNPKTQRSTVIGSLAGYFSGVMIVLCFVGVAAVFLLVFSGR